MNDIHDTETQHLRNCSVQHYVCINPQSHRECSSSQAKQNITLRATLFNFAVTLRLKLFILAIILMLPALLSAQLRELEITPDTTPATIPVFTDHPGNAAVIINSSIPNLQFSTTLEIVHELSDPASGRYILIIPPFRQSISVSAPGYISQSFSVGAITAREVRYFRVEPKNVSITETGRFILRTNPAGARVTIDGIPGTFTTPHTFDELLAQRYTVRISLQDYEDEEIQVDVNPDRPLVRDVTLQAFFGNLIVWGNANQIWLKSTEDEEEYRVTVESGKPLRLPPGEYAYRLTRNFYTESAGTFSIELGETTQLSADLASEYSRLRVNANTPNIQLTSIDNLAPPSNEANVIFLERGVRNVQVSAPGFEPINIMVRSVAGAQRDTTVTLITSAEMDDRRRREALPRGILTVRADAADAQIFLNGELQGEGEITMSLVPERYNIELRHPARNRSFFIDVPSAEIIERNEVLLPSKGRAVMMNGLLPGTGHLYTRRSRGYLYLGAAVGAGVFTYLMHADFKENERLHGQQYTLYLNAQSMDAAARYRLESERYFDSKSQAYDLMLIGAGALVGVYVLQMIDVAVTRPAFGYRGRTADARLSAGFTGAGFIVSYSLH